ncbi:MAG: right-handed parallel beta-helix repeat-containing protein [Rubrobacteraceae bacterium]|nr:right-handed parallel beta-helix repeat-containing protein [Rubrobacteraceae bacterium]
MRVRIKLLVASIFAVSLASAAVAGVVLAKSPARSGTVFVGPGQSIQAAVNHARPGTTIIVRGTHRESVVIRKDGLRLLGRHAVIRPPARPGPCGSVGLCVLGDVNPATGQVAGYVSGVGIFGFTVRDFDEFGIFALGARDATFMHNRAVDNGEYGIAAFDSTGTRMISNTTSGSTGEAGLYVGDSPHANATVVGNDSYGNEFGILVRNATHGRIAGNDFHDNCLGALFLADEPGPAGAFRMVGNKVQNNSRSCPAHEEIPDISGVGVAILGAHDVSLAGNSITGNVASGSSIVRGGVVVVRGLGGTPPKDNSVVGNTIVRNGPDIFWDGSGSGNRFVGNRCNTSVPGGLCRR